MKILCLNIPQIDFTYFLDKGLKLEVEHGTINQKFFLRYLNQVKDTDGTMVSVYTPEVKDFLEKNYPEKKYDVIMVGWKPIDYDDKVKHTGGYTYPDPMKNGTRICTIREDAVPNNIYPVHELMHCLVGIINIDFGFHQPIDYMDLTPVIVDCDTGIPIQN